jgi:hypothetical protein
MNIEALKLYLSQNGHADAIGPFGPVVLQDNSDGNGLFIAKWDLPIPQPTPEQLEQPE